ncbi:MAG: hypothetical protein ACFFBD_09885, partial [Candidatus Hodarchaeota archaeon]
MGVNEINEKKRFYLVSVDFIQGFLLFIMIFGHALLWWNRPLALAWDTGDSIVIFFLIGVGLMVFPYFLFFYGFNTVNSLLKKDVVSNRPVLRLRLIRKNIFFALSGFFLQFIMGLLTPGYLLNFLVSWQIFHMFAFLGVFLLFIFEITWWLENQSKISNYLDIRQIVSILFMLCLVLVLGSFLIFHNYSQQKVNLFTDLN